jgi:hypothetical protein
MGQTLMAVRMTIMFEPPLQLTGKGTVIRSLDDAACFMREYVGRWPATRDLMLRRLSTASTEQEANDAARSFRWWAEMEGLLIQE